ncbi:MAG: DUF4440 domain-containing protein [Ignavibacteria bacterium]|jgi:hypothetical protein|nr:DUF4440 domain-containing protein [Ignavibacteria bacterium]MCU7517020.1 DUF4440 domain-containing protein [Ignavibacteria bacterium]
MEPVLITDQKHLSIRDELLRLEALLHHPEKGTMRKELEEMTDELFWEVGASGNRYSRSFVLSVLEERVENSNTEDKWETKDAWCNEISANNFLLTYTLIQGKRITRRSSIWRKYENSWKIVYHQGTIV